MPNVARLTDPGVGVCVAHESPIPMTGVIITGSSNVNANGLAVARIGDVVLGACGHTGVLIEGSANVNANGRAVVRVGDAFAGSFSGVIVSGSGDVLANENQ